MKKIMSMVICAFVSISLLTACGSGDTGASTTVADETTEAAATTEKPEESVAEETAEETEATEASEAEATFAAAPGAGKSFIVSTDTVFPPFEFTDENNDFVGIDVDIINAIAEDQGFTVQLDSLGFDAALIAVQADQADGVIAGMSITEERKETFDFSDPYFDSDIAMAVAQDSDIQSFEDLSGENVALKTGTISADFAQSIADEYGFTYTEFADSPTMYQDVIAGGSVACFEDYPVMAFNIQQGAQLQLVDGIREAGNSYGFAVKKGENSDLLEMFNAGLKNIRDNGIYDEIVEKYTK